MGANVPPHHHVLQRSHFRKEANILESPRNSSLSHRMDCRRLVGFSGQLKTATVGRVHACEYVKKCGLSGTIGANQAVHLTALNFDAHIAQSLQATKALGHTRNVQYCICHFLFPFQFLTFCKDLPCSGDGHSPRGRSNMTLIMAKAIKNWRKMEASKRPPVISCKGPAT